MWPRRVVVGVLALVFSLGVLSPADAIDDDGPRRGDCAGDSEVRLRVLPDEEGRITVIGLVFSSDEDVWEWRMRHNDDLSASGRTRARDDDRSLRIARTMIDVPGVDSITFYARNTVTDEVCRRTREL